MAEQDMQVGRIAFGPHVERGGHPRLTYWASDVIPLVQRLTQERDQLTQEVERLKVSEQKMTIRWGEEACAVIELTQENARLKEENATLRDGVKARDRRAGVNPEIREDGSVIEWDQ